MIEFTKKSCTYFAATLTFLLGLKVSLGVAFSWRWLAVLGVVVLITSVVVAWVEVFHDAKESARKATQSADEGSVSLGIKRALSQVRFAPRDDESIAHEANRIVRRGLDKRCISYKNYREWRHKNPLIFTA